MKRGNRWSQDVGRWVILSVLLVGLAACNDFPQEWFQVQNDLPDPAFVIITTVYGRNIYAIQPRSTVALGSFNSQDGEVEVLGPTCKVLATFGAPETQNTIFDPKSKAWLGSYQITIPEIGSPTVGPPTNSIGANAPALQGAVLDPTKTDPSVCPPVTVPGAVPQGQILLPETRAVPA
jgi:hypothetical protein